MTRPIAIDLFCGAGGMSLGFEQAGFDVVLGVDRDAYHCAAHERNFPHGKTLCASVSELTGERVRAVAEIKGEIDVVFGGPPCQGFSMMGKRDTGDPRSSLVGEFVRIVKELQPKAFVMENVPGMQLGKTRVFFDFVVDALSAAGYKIKLPAQTLVASDFGAPQKRERLFVIGIRSDLPGLPKYPEGPLSGQAFAKNIKEAFEGLPDVDQFDELMSDDHVQKPRAAFSGENYSAVMAGEVRDDTDLSHPRVLCDELIFGNKRTRHAPASVSLYAATQPGEIVPGHKLPRLSMDGLSPTLRAGSESERGSHTAPRPIHPNRARCITVREAARLHGYPDWFAFYPVIHHGFRQVGNSVSPLVARAVGYSVAESLGIEISKRSPAKPIQLTNEFHLIDDRKKHEKRISHLDEFPKVINHLFSRRFDLQKNKLLQSRFSHADISDSIKASGANMPRIRPESFLAEFSRTRNAIQILKTPMSFGYSIIPTQEGGEFVLMSNPAAIGSASYVSFSSAEVKAAFAVTLGGHVSNSVDRSFAILASPKLAESFGTIIRESDLFGSSVPSKQTIRVKRGRKVLAGAFWKTRSKMIKYEAIKKFAADRDAEVVILSVELTRQHEGLVACDISSGGVVERTKQVIYISDQQGQQD